MATLRLHVVRPVLCGLVAVMLVGGVTSGSHPVAAAPASAPGPAATPSRPYDPSSGKPDGPLAVALHPDGPGRATATVSAQGVSSVRLEITGTGQATGAGSSTVTLGSAGTATAPVTYVVADGGSGSVVATVRGTDTNGDAVVRSAVLYVRSSYGQPIASDQGTLDLALQHLQRGRDLGRLTAAQFAAETRAVEGGGAAATVSVVPGGESPNAAAPVTAAAAGQIRWTDSVGGIHPVRGATVQIQDAETTGSVLVTSTTTDDNGNYAVSFDNNDGPGEGGRDVFISVLAEGPSFIVKGSNGVVQFMVSPTTNNVADGALLSLSLTANNTADNNTAFSVQDAMTTVTRYVKVVNGSLLPTLSVFFPSGAGTYFDGSTLQILQLDRWDHDVVGHEFGHFVQAQKGITQNPGGPHVIGSNTAEQLGKQNGLRLAWGEGWPTYFAITAQKQQNAAAQNIPHVGDSNYTDLEDSNIDISLESSASYADVGEDDELSSIRILFDAYDTNADAGDDRGIGLGDKALWDIVVNAHAFTLNDFYNAAVAGKTLQQVADYGCIFSEHKVAPAITSPANGAAPTVPPTITWAANGLGPSFRNNQFSVKYYNAGSNTLLFTSPLQAGTTYTPSQSTWNAILADPGTKIDVVVSGTNTAAPLGSPYVSCNVSLTQPK